MPQNKEKNQQHESQGRYQSVEQMQLDDFSVMKSVEVSNFENLPLSEIQVKMKEEEQKFRINLWQTENQYLEKFYKSLKNSLTEFTKSEDTTERKKLFHKQLKNVYEYAENLQNDYYTLKNRMVSYEKKFNEVKKQDMKIAHLSEEIEKRKAKNVKNVEEKTINDTIFKTIKGDKEKAKAEIVIYQNQIQDHKERKFKFDVLQTKLKKMEDEQIIREKRIEELNEKIKAVSNMTISIKEKHETEIQRRAMRIKNLKLEIEQKMKLLKDMEEMQKLLTTLEEREKCEFNNRQNIFANQTAELKKLKNLKENLKRKIEIEATNSDKFYKDNNKEFISLNEMEIDKIQEYVENYVVIIDETKIQVEKSKIDLENLTKTREEEMQTKRDQYEKAKSLLEAEKLEIEEKRIILVELNQKIIDTLEKVEKLKQEKQKNWEHKKHALSRKEGLREEIQGLKLKIDEVVKNIALAENMYKDVCEVNRHINEALNSKENLKVEVTRFETEYKKQLGEIKNQIVETSKAQNNKILELETEIAQNAKIYAEKKREAKKQDSQNIIREQTLRKKILKLQEEIAALDKQRKAEQKIETESEDTLSTSAEEIPQNLKSILKRSKSIEPKSPKKCVQFENLSPDDSLTEIPLTQKPNQSP